MADKEKIRKEVEKCYSDALERAKIFNTDYWEGKADAYRNVLIQLESLQEEPVSRTPADIEAAMQEVEEKSMAFTEAHKGESSDEILAQMRGEEPVSNDLKEAASQYPSVIRTISPQWESELENAFKAGAKWQKEQMITKAIDMTVGYWMPNGLRLDVDETENPYNIDEGNKVKLIIIKDE